MFIPGFGIVLGIFTAFSTGVAFSAISQASPSFVSNQISPLIVFLTPFGVLEAIAYGIAISRSGILSFQLIKTKNKKKYWKEKFLIPTVIEIGIVISLLFIGAIIEWQMVQQSVRVGQNICCVLLEMLTLSNNSSGYIFAIYITAFVISLVITSIIIVIRIRNGRHCNLCPSRAQLSLQYLQSSNIK